eukprot:1897947-Alexandrium_andersonii.AAC.1
MLATAAATAPVEAPSPLVPLAGAGLAAAPAGAAERASRHSPAARRPSLRRAGRAPTARCK